MSVSSDFSDSGGIDNSSRLFTDPIDAPGARLSDSALIGHLG